MTSQLLVAMRWTFPLQSWRTFAYIAKFYYLTSIGQLAFSNWTFAY